MKAIALRIIKQIRNDKRSLALLIAAPLFVLTLIYFLLGDSDYTPTIAIDRANTADILVEALEKENVTVIELTGKDLENPEEYLKEHRDIDLIVKMPVKGMDVYMLESSSKSGEAIEALQHANTSLYSGSVLTVHTVYGENNQSNFETFGYIFPGIFSFFFVFLISGMALVRERSTGTLERLLMTSIKRREVIFGYTAGLGLFAAIQAVLIITYTIFVLRLHCEGNILWVVLTMLLISITAVSLGALVSIFSTTEFQIVQFVPVIIVPQMFFSGLIPLDTIPLGLGNLCYVMPIYYGCTAIKKVLTEGGGFGSIWLFLLALSIYTVVLGILNTAALRKYRAL